MKWPKDVDFGYCHLSVSYSNRRIAIALILSLAFPLVVAAPALADEVAAQVTSFRGASLPVIAGADRVAGASAAAQAAAGTLFHADLSGLLGECDSVGEVVGSAVSAPAVFAAFQGSSSHRSIIIDPAWTAIGTGAATAADGSVYVSVVFCRQAGKEAPPVVSQPAPTKQEEAPAASPEPQSPPAPVVAEVTEPVPALEELLPAVGARRAEIRARLDRQARSMLPDWYTGVCGEDDRERMLGSETADSGACPKAS